MLGIILMRKVPRLHQASHAWPMRCGFVADCSGTTATIFGLSLSALVGFAGLGTEVGNWYFTKRAMQGAADSAAYSAALAKGSGASTTVYASEAKSIAGTYNFVDGSNGVTVTVNNPPTSGSYTRDAAAVEVKISKAIAVQLVSLFHGSPVTVQARAVARTNATGCVLALDTGSVTDVTDSGSTTMNLNNCSLYVNSPASNALSLSGGATINAYSANISGNYTTSGGSSLTTVDGTHTGVSAQSDPYSDVPIPSYSGCNRTSYQLSSGSASISAGSSPYVFCNGLTVSGGASLTLGPGVYIIDRGQFDISSSTVTATGGVTIVLTSSTGSNYATATISGGSTATITAPTSGPTAGLAFFQDRNAPSSGSDTFSGGSAQKITGAIYFPHQKVTFSGGSSSGGAACTQLIGWTITFSGSSTFNNNCAEAGVRGIGGSLVQLVE